MRRADTDSNAVIDLGEFVKYMHAHERKLHLAFTSLDRNHDGECTIMFCLFVTSLCYYFAASCPCDMLIAFVGVITKMRNP